MTLNTSKGLLYTIRKTYPKLNNSSNCDLLNNLDKIFKNTKKREFIFWTGSRHMKILEADIKTELKPKMYTLVIIRLLENDIQEEINGGFYSHDDVEKFLIDYKFSDKEIERFDNLLKFEYTQLLKMDESDTLVAYIHRIK